ncbi:MAG TPA: YciI family protein [Candidatus Saccharimonadia bacterium]|nr:YciI family protein [Candidatus Saccharimonadia bacterium]
MANYLIVNHSDGTTPPATPDEWMGFFGSVLGAHVVDGGKPLTTTKTVVKNGKTSDASDTAVGYYIIKADSLKEASDLIEKSPLSNRPGCEVRVYELRDM